MLSFTLLNPVIFRRMLYYSLTPIYTATSPTSFIPIYMAASTSSFIPIHIATNTTNFIPIHTATSFASFILIYIAASNTSLILIFYIATSSIKRIYIYKKRVENTTLGFTSLDPITLGSCQPY